MHYARSEIFLDITFVRIHTIKWDKTLSLCCVNSFILFVFFVEGSAKLICYVQVQYYTLGLSLKFNPRLVISRKFRYRASKTGASQPTPCYPEITTRAKTPSTCQIPTSEIPLLIPSRNIGKFKSVGVLS